MSAPGCNRAPGGWTCARGAGHPGPCAASPADGLNAREALQELRNKFGITPAELLREGADVDQLGQVVPSPATWGAVGRSLRTRALRRNALEAKADGLLAGAVATAVGAGYTWWTGDSAGAALLSSVAGGALVLSLCVRARANR